MPAQPHITMADLSDAPQLVRIFGLEIVLLDAVLHCARDEAVVLLTVADPQLNGPWVIERTAILSPERDGQVFAIAQEALLPGPRIAVPGERVQRLRVLRQAVGLDERIPWRLWPFAECTCWTWGRRRRSSAWSSSRCGTTWASNLCGRWRCGFALLGRTADGAHGFACAP
jgi:hypothetical protein